MKKVALLLFLILVSELSYSQVDYNSDNTESFGGDKRASFLFSFSTGLMPKQKIFPDYSLTNISYTSRVEPSYDLGFRFSYSTKKLKFATGLQEYVFTTFQKLRVDSSILGYNFDTENFDPVSAFFSIPLCVSYKIINNKNVELTGGIQFSINRMPAYSNETIISNIDSVTNQVSDIMIEKEIEPGKDFIEGGLRVDFERRIYHKIFFNCNFNSLLLSNLEIMNGKYTVYGIHKNYTGSISKRLRYFAVGLGIGWCF